jgi:segregation and condensation protein B
MSDAPAPASPGELPAILEALLFVAEEPQTLAALARATGVSDGAASKALDRLRSECEGRGIRLMEDGHRFQLVSAPAYAPYVEQLLGNAAATRLSRAALETLTIIAYRQPCSRAEIEALRGVNSDKLVTMLEQRGLIDLVGTGEGPGKPKLYRTTMKFLEHFGIRSPGELPPLPGAEEPFSEAEI